MRNLFFSGFQGNEAALEKGLAATEETLKENPDHAEALVWHGAGLYYKAGQLFQKGDNQKGMELAMKGMAEMDRAVLLEAKSIGVRIPRGAVMSSAGRRMTNPAQAKMMLDRALTDYEAAYELQQPMLDKMPEHPKGELLLGVADLNARAGNTEKAAEIFEKLKASMPGTRYAESAALWLETKSNLPAAKAGCMGCHVGK